MHNFFGEELCLIKVTRENCISCELCVMVCPEVFRMAEDGFAEAYVATVPESSKDAVREAEDGCPVSAISAE